MPRAAAEVVLHAGDQRRASQASAGVASAQPSASTSSAGQAGAAKVTTCQPRAAPR